MNFASSEALISVHDVRMWKGSSDIEHEKVR